MSVFYPIRHQVAHRQRIWGAGFKDDRRGGGAVLAEIDQEFVQAIDVVDEAEESSPYSLWGTFRCEGAILLEPYRFTRQAVVRLHALVDQILRTILIDKFGIADSDIQTSKRQHWGAELSIPFPRQFI